MSRLTLEQKGQATNNPEIMGLIRASSDGLLNQASHSV